MLTIKVYDLFFFLDVALILSLLGLTCATAWIYARALIWRRHGRGSQFIRDRATHVLLIGGGFAYLLIGALFSLFTTSRHGDPSIYFFPPGFISMILGIGFILRKGSLATRRYQKEA